MSCQVGSIRLPELSCIDSLPKRCIVKYDFHIFSMYEAFWRTYRPARFRDFPGIDFWVVEVGRCISIETAAYSRDMNDHAAIRSVITFLTVFISSVPIG